MKNKYSQSVIYLFFLLAALIFNSCSDNDEDDYKATNFAEIPVAEKMQIAVTILEDGTTVMLPLSGTVKCEINWDDGSQDKVEDTFPIHTYSKKGEYLIEIYGTVTALSTNELYASHLPLITAVHSWGNTGLTNMYGAFEGCTGLTYLADHNEHDSFAKVFSFANAFFGCTGLTELPEELFSNCSKALTFSKAFFGCVNLSKIPSGLFDDCTAVTDFKSAFQDCTKLTMIPVGLFDYCTQAEDFELVFKNCTGLTVIPIGLFDNCKEAKSFTSAFQNCNNLTGIPTALFDNCKYIRNISLAFAGCTNLTGESPYTLIDGNKVHLYERRWISDGFTQPSGSLCFSECSGLSDYANMPSTWK